jgi:hypothetical protein
MASVAASTSSRFSAGSGRPAIWRSISSAWRVTSAS